MLSNPSCREAELKKIRVIGREEEEQGENK